MNRGLNRSQLKGLATAFMVLDNAYLRFPVAISSVAHLVTRFVAPLFVWLMVDGFFHTRSRARYCTRLWIAAACMQAGNVLSCALFGQAGIYDNIFLTLALAFSIIWLFETARSAGGSRGAMLYVAAIAAAILAILLSVVLYIPLPFGSAVMVEGGLQLIPFALIAYFFHDSLTHQSLACLAYCLLVFFTLYGGPTLFSQGFDMFCVNSDWMTFLMIPFMYAYNGQEGRSSAASKWFFYIFYPAHLWILLLASTAL